MLNRKGFGTKRSWLNFKVLTHHSPGGTIDHGDRSDTCKFVCLRTYFVS
jgi:hypothetical protein